MSHRPIAGRYRVVGTLRSEGGMQVHVCDDMTLSRRVRVRVFGSDLDPSIAQSRASAAATLTHPRIARVFDSGFDNGQFYVVSEHANADIASHPPPPSAVKSVIDQTRAALRYAADRGVEHGHLQAHHLLVADSGIKIDGMGMAPLAGVETVSDAAALASIADALGAQTPEVVESPTRPQPANRRIHPAYVGVAVLLVAAVAWTARPGRAPVGDESEVRTSPPETERFTIESVADFDPFGDGTENRGTVARIYDGDPSTFWVTEKYRSSADFNSSKSGVGVILHLDEPHLVGYARVRTPSPGCSIQIRSAETRHRNPDDWQVMADLGAQTQTDVTVTFPATRTEWWLLWVNRLTTGVPDSGNAFACGISEVDLYAP